MASTSIGGNRGVEVSRCSGLGCSIRSYKWCKSFSYDIHIASIGYTHKDHAYRMIVVDIVDYMRCRDAPIANKVYKGSQIN